MKVLFIASNPLNQDDLNLQAEINELQSRFAFSSAEPVSFHFLPDIKVEKLPSELSKFKPDVIHIVSHAQATAMSLSDETGKEIKVTAEMLDSFLPPECPPRLVYLNCCESSQIAGELVNLGTVSMAIGSTGQIENLVAQASAIAFYHRLVSGLSVQRAYDTGRRMLEALAEGRASLKLCHSPNVVPAFEIIHKVPVLVADFFGDKIRRTTTSRAFRFRLGLLGCSDQTSQIIFFTDDARFATESSLERSMCLVSRDLPQDGIIWTPDGGYWESRLDHKLFATCVRATGGCYVIESGLCKAIEARYKTAPGGKCEKSLVREVLNELRTGKEARVPSSKAG
jgi:hypothetical protein